MKKRLMSILLALMAVLSISVSAGAAEPVIRRTEYEGGGYIEVDFTKHVAYRNVKVTVKDASGTKRAATIVERDRDDLTFYAANLKPGGRYTYTISGIRAGRSGGYKTVSGSFRVPKRDSLIEDIEYDGRDRELSIAFMRRVQYRKLQVTITGPSGKTIPSRIAERDGDELELVIPKGLQSGKKYTVTVSGIRAKGSGAYGRVTGEFRVS